MTPLVTAGDAIYRLHQRLWSAWARGHYARDFEQVRAFCLFVGYPRSGHSLVGALLNAHRNAVVSHELNAPEYIVAGCSREVLYSRILARARWFHLRGDRGYYPYRIPNQWQGRFESLEVIGDKRGGAASRFLAAHPDLFDRLRALVGVPLRLVHVVRHPLDNIAAISIANSLTLSQSAEAYFALTATTVRLDDVSDPRERFTLYHEDLVREPRQELTRLCEFVGLDAESRYLDDCCSVVFPSPTFTRRKVDWPAALVGEIRDRARAIPHLERYRIDLDVD